jgi:hypothetical protein
LPPHNARLHIVALSALALAAAGCSSSMFDKGEGTSLFSKPVDIFAKPDWAQPQSDKIAGSDVDTGGPVGPDDLVGADGRCTAAMAQAPATPAAANTPQASASVGRVSGELGSEPAPATGAAPASFGAPTVVGGIALGMTECQTVRRAGQPGNVSVSASDKGQRQVVLTYLGGSWPGIYHFSDGRLKEIDRVSAPPEAPKPPKKPPKKKPAPKTSQIETVQ